MPPHPPVRRRALALLVAVAVATTTAVIAATAPSAAARTTTSPYSDPIWYPLRDRAQVGCVGDGSGVHNGGSNCDQDHRGYFGINLLFVDVGSHGVYASGAGRVIETVTNKRQTCGAGSAGNFVAIDHGGGRVSLYEHLTSVAVQVGQYVSAATRVGTIVKGGTGCAYLDFVVRTSGGDYQDLTQTINTLRACTSSGAETWPTHQGYSAWVHVPYHGMVTPASTSGCGQSGVRSAAGAPSRPALTPGGSRVVVGLPSRQGVAMVRYQLYRPSAHSWDSPCSPYQTRTCTVGYLQVPASARSYRVSGLQNGRLYRFRVSVHDANGWSTPSSWRNVTPRTAPLAPGFLALHGYATRVQLRWSMHNASLRGSTVRGFQVAISRKMHSRYTKWAYHRVGNVHQFTWKHTRPHTRYRVTVRALSNAGPGKWMTARARTTLRR